MSNDRSAMLQARTKQFALDVIRCTSRLSRSRSNEVLQKQVLRSACSIGANYREAARAESRNDFVHKIAICAKEAAETEYWLELLLESNGEVEDLPRLLAESNELLRIMISSAKTAKKHR